MVKVPGILLAGSPTGPAWGTDPPGLKCSKSTEPLMRRGGLLQRSYRSQLENGPIRWARTGESSLLYTSVDASRPHKPPPITRGRNGGAAGNRTRVRSAYYKRVYRHSPGKPGQSEYRLKALQFQAASADPSGWRWKTRTPAIQRARPRAAEHVFRRLKPAKAAGQGAGGDVGFVAARTGRDQTLGHRPRYIDLQP